MQGGGGTDDDDSNDLGCSNFSKLCRNKPGQSWVDILTDERTHAALSQRNFWLHEPIRSPVRIKYRTLRCITSVTCAPHGLIPPLNPPSRRGRGVTRRVRAAEVATWFVFISCASPVVGCTALYSVQEAF